MSSELIHRAQTKQSHEPISDSDSTSPSNSLAKHSTNPIRYVLRERAPFLLIGVAIATLFFHVLPSRSSSPIPSPPDPFPSLKPELALPTRRVLLEEATSTTTGSVRHNNAEDSDNGIKRKGRVPLGVRLKSKAKRILVTGGAGFVGSHLVDRLMERGDSVIVVDNFFTGRKENLLHHMGNPNFELIRHDVVEPILLEVDQIYHLACPASPVHYKFNPVKTIISFPFYIASFFLFICFPLFSFVGSQI